MANEINKKDSITIGRKEFTLDSVMMDQADLRFYSENPRIHSLVYADNPNPSQEYIQDISFDIIKKSIVVHHPVYEFGFIISHFLGYFNDSIKNIIRFL